ncbi:methyltransferase [Vitiosangium sp. GDMCC 1.1324]|nr:methyltransferase [Vitiosangium sp. GDMCC 1.1324]
MQAAGSSLQDARVRGVLERLHRSARGDLFRLPRAVVGNALTQLSGRRLTPEMRSRAMKDVYIPISAEQGKFLYLVARSIGARTVVEFGTSFGISTLYLAAAVRDAGGGRVIGSELEESKQRQATANMAEAGFSDLVEVRLGDAVKTLATVEGPIDLVLLDGWKDLYLPVLQVLTPKLRKGAVVLADNIFTFRKALRPYVEHMQSGRNGFQSTTLTIADGFEYSVYVGE